MAKKLLNSANSCVLDGLEGLAYMAPSMRLVEGHQIVVRSDIDQVKLSGKVTILCGGGAGHEPAHAGKSNALWPEIRHFAATAKLAHMSRI